MPAKTFRISELHSARSYTGGVLSFETLKTAFTSVEGGGGRTMRPLYNIETA